MKYLVVVLVVVGILWLMLKRTTRPGDDAGDTARKAPRKAAPPEVSAMLACAHCGVHVPQGEMLRDARGLSFCSEAHRVAGPR